MQNPLQISFRGIPHSDAVEIKIREKAEKLEKFYPHIVSCKVVVDSEHHKHHQGNLYHIRINITTPQKEIVVSHEHHDKQEHEDIYVVIRDSFKSAQRQLENHAQMQRGNVKKHTHETEQEQEQAITDQIELDDPVEEGEPIG